MATKSRTRSRSPGSSFGTRALQREWAELSARFRETAFFDYLKSFALEFSRIPGLGPAEPGTLASQAGAIELSDVRRQTLARRDVLGRAQDGLHQRLAQLRADARSTRLAHVSLIAV